jgi:zinc protease
MKQSPIKWLALILLLISISCKKENANETKEFKVDYEKITLDNGLQVIFHIDRSDPVCLQRVLILLLLLILLN